ncbi:IclR family transcriptional regulator [Sphingomonas sp. ASV193]|uniref:IclR family transcriptional regulator n=1 Tax=Sphingomonas sp. ASV193 TaxID=3144405 RepID=UPI0032E8AE48
MGRKAVGGAKGGELYRAPALEKGLDVLELLAAESEPLSLSAIVQRLGRSTGELFRMIQVLERRGMVAQGSDGYSLTTRLFELGLGRPVVRNLVELSLPVMRELTGKIGQSCHLVIPSGSNMVVVARMESREQIGFSVRVGHHRPLHLTASGLMLYAFQSPDLQKKWEEGFDPKPSKADLAAFRQRAKEVHRDGYLQQLSNFAEGVTDLAAPVLRGDHAAASLSVPFVKMKVAQMSIEDVGVHLREAASKLSAELVLNDARI